MEAENEGTNPAASGPSSTEAKMKDFVLEAQDTHANNETTTVTPERITKTAPGTICGVCNNQESKYKCSKCQLPL
jgi:hypothetical protein